MRYCTNLETLELPASLRIIGEKAFIKCAKLESVHFKPGVEVIGRRSFSELDSLEEIEFPATVSEFGEETFNLCPNLRKVVIGAGGDAGGAVNAAAGAAGPGCAADSGGEIRIPSVVRLGRRMFRGCPKLETVDLSGCRAVDIGGADGGFTAFSQMRGGVRVIMPPK